MPWTRAASLSTVCAPVRGRYDAQCVGQDGDTVGIRADYVQQLYCEALLELSETMPLEKVTVTAIIQRAGTARQTFYNHFRDINDLISYLPINFLRERSTGDLYDFDAVGIAYDYAREHRAFFRQLPGHAGQNNFRESFILWLEESYYHVYTSDDMQPDERMYRMIAIDTYVSGVTDVFLEWCKADFSWPLDVLLRAQEDCAPPFVRERDIRRADPVAFLQESPRSQA